MLNKNIETIKLMKVYSGKTYKQMAAEIGISYATMKNFLSDKVVSERVQILIKNYINKGE